MTDREKIDLLINAQTKENNYLALQLMLDVLGYDFQKAFLSLKPYKASINLLYLEIAEIKIEYDVRFEGAIDIPSVWCNIKRNVYCDKKLLPEMFHKYYLDEDEVWHIEDFDAIEQLSEIHTDLKGLTSVIEQLFLAL